MSTDSKSVVRRAYEALASGNPESMLDLVDPDLEWTYLDPSVEHPEPEVCRGRDQLALWVSPDRRPRSRPELEEISGYGERVLVVTHSPGIDATRARKAGDRSFHVVTVRNGRIVALRACRDREEAAALASSPTEP